MQTGFHYTFDTNAQSRHYKYTVGLHGSKVHISDDPLPNLLIITLLGRKLDVDLACLLFLYRYFQELFLNIQHLYFQYVPPSLPLLVWTDRI